MKKRSLTILSIVLVALLAVGVTFAYLTATTGTKTNTFTLGDNIDIELTEPAWDADGGGKDLSQNFVPGRNIPKDPKVTNTKDKDVWVAIKLEYEGDANSFEAIDAFAYIDFNSNWEAKDTSKTVFYYNAILAPSATTSDLFTRVLIDSDKAHSQLKSFNIKVTAYAVQAEGVTAAEAKGLLDDLM